MDGPSKSKQRLPAHGCSGDVVAEEVREIFSNSARILWRQGTLGLDCLIRRRIANKDPNHTFDFFICFRTDRQRTEEVCQNASLLGKAGTSIEVWHTWLQCFLSITPCRSQAGMLFTTATSSKQHPATALQLREDISLLPTPLHKPARNAPPIPRRWARRPIAHMSVLSHRVSSQQPEQDCEGKGEGACHAQRSVRYLTRSLH